MAKSITEIALLSRVYRVIIIACRIAEGEQNLIRCLNVLRSRYRSEFQLEKEANGKRGTNPDQTDRRDRTMLIGYRRESNARAVIIEQRLRS